MSNGQDANIVIKDGDNEVQYSLADLGNVDVTEIERFRMAAYKFPIGLYDWEVKLLETRQVANKNCFFNAFVCIGVEETADPDIHVEDLIGKQHVELLFLPVEEGKKPTMEDINKWFGMFKDLMLSIGASASGKLGEIQTNTVGYRFKGPVIHQYDQKKPNVYYSKLDLDKCTALPPKNETTVAA